MFLKLDFPSATMQISEPTKRGNLVFIWREFFFHELALCIANAAIRIVAMIRQSSMVIASKLSEIEDSEIPGAQYREILAT
jgi:hypothetical protein